ncbi:MAG: hypothetical protein LBH43_01510 [Treponema sp.]|nr:hypothetical protein [Treponema sp.]
MSLREIIRRDKFIIDKDEYSDNDFAKMSTEDLETLKLRINDKINFISTTIKASQIEQSMGGERTTKDWYVRHKNALSVNQQVLAYVNRLIKQRRKAERPFSDFFMAEAKATLKPEEFDLIMGKAKTEMNREGYYENC